MINRFLKCSLVLALCFSSQAFANEHFPFQAKISKETVNIRAGSNTNFERVDQLHLGDEITVVGREYQWYKIKMPSTAQAYVRADYVQIKDGVQGEITGDKVNIRARANSDSSSLGILLKGSVVTIISQENGWCKVAPPAEAFAWVSEEFVSR